MSAENGEGPYPPRVGAFGDRPDQGIDSDRSTATETQLPLFGSLATAPTEQETLDGRFWAYHLAHPEVYSELRRLSLAAVRAGRTRLGMQMVAEVARWNSMLERPEGDYKINNSFTSRYARLLMAREPELEGVFELRELQTDSTLGGES